ncbi:class I SAM-dependent methyltransferase, partial [Telluria sp. Tellsp131]
VTQYESLSFEDVHADQIGKLPAPGSTVHDIGAGSGRDAAWLAAKGYDVVDVEPTEAMLDHARAKHTTSRIQWLSDS